MRFALELARRGGGLAVVCALGAGAACGLDTMGTGAPDLGLPGDGGDGGVGTVDAGAPDTGPPDAGCLPPAPDMVAWWTGDGDMSDHLGANPGDAGSQAGATGMAYAPGEVGQAFDLGGKSYVQIADAPAFQLKKAVTVEAWINAAALGGRLVDKTSVGKGDGILLDTFNSKLRFDVGSSSLSTPSPLTTNAWLHVAGTWDGSATIVYVNGTAAATGTAGSLPTNTIALRLGADNTGQSRFNGKLDEVALYGRALTAAEIGQIYAAGPKGRCK